MLFGLRLLESVRIVALRMFALPESPSRGECGRAGSVFVRRSQSCVLNASGHEASAGTSWRSDRLQNRRTEAGGGGGDSGLVREREGAVAGVALKVVREGVCAAAS